MPRILALNGKALTIMLVSARRAVLTVATTLALMVLAPTRIAQQDCAIPLNPECPAFRNKIDVAFIIDRSGSMAIDQLGHTYNVEVEGVVRALRDPSVIPRDRSIAVSVWTFSEKPNMVTPLKEIGSAADADAIATIVEGLKCTSSDCNPTGFCPAFGLNPASNYAPVISLSYTHLNQNHRPGARQAMLLSSDGQPTDLPKALIEATTARDSASTSGVQLELDLILLNPTPDARNNADTLVFPKPADDLPGKTLPIATGKANTPCASLSDAAVQMDFERQVREFDTHTRNVLRSFVPKIPALIVNTEVDPDPGTPLNGETLSLRQAIEFANCNGGAATITFANQVNTISPRVPLPALTAPEITIDGLTGRTSPRVTIDGSKTDTTNCDQLDGILIRSNRDVVRALRIIGFKRAGVGVEPVNPADNVGSNRIELNRFEMNAKAGVCVLDPPQGQEAAVFHNVGNTISMNDISGSETPIDLARETIARETEGQPARLERLDGPTPNDPGDLDEGPNTLLNFPDKLAVPPSVQVTVTAAGVTLAGSLSGPTVAGATVEIFAITSFRPVSGGRAIDGILFLKTTTANADGTFIFTGLDDSPTCGYTATVTDTAANTSEVMFPCAGLGVAEMPDQIVFSTAEPNGSPLVATFAIANTGCGSLALSSFSVNRVDSRNELSSLDDTSHFSIISPAFGPARTIAPGQTQNVTVQFDPAIPRRSKNSLPLRPAASETLPNQIVSNLTINHDGCGDKVIALRASVTTRVRLIHPKRTSKRPRVTLERSGDLFTATFSVYDSNSDVQRAMYELLDGAGRTVGPDTCCADLTAVQSKYATGQSFTVFQRFDHANDHPDVVAIRLTVFDRDGASETVTSDPITTIVGSQSLKSKVTARPARPPVGIGPALDKHPHAARGR